MTLHEMQKPTEKLSLVTQMQNKHTLQNEHKNRNDLTHFFLLFFHRGIFPTNGQENDTAVKAFGDWRGQVCGERYLFQIFSR